MTIYRRYGLRLLIVLLVVVYTLTSAGRFHIIDEVSLFAVTESVATRRALDTNTIAWTQWVNSPGEVLGEFGPDGQVYSKKGPAPALLAVPWYALLRTLALLDAQIGLLQGTLLWNGLLTAFTAALLWLTAVRLGYGDRTGAVLGLLYGLGTIAWPYAKHFFGEPLSALALLLCFYSLLAYRQNNRIGWMWLAGLGAGLALATVTAHAVLISLLGIYWLWGEIRTLWATRDAFAQHGSRLLLRFFLALSAFATPLLLISGLLLWYNRIRFGDPFVTGYHFDSGEGFTTPLWQGLWGLLFSPYRGLFWHTPLFLASLIGFVPFVRRHRDEGIVLAALSLALIGLYSTWWMWWGGFAWGPRFLVPLAPFWVLVLAPLVSWIETLAWRTEPGRRGHMPDLAVSGFSASALPVPTLPIAGLRTVGLGVALIALAALSLGVQLLAVSVNYVNYEILLREIFPTDWSNPLAFGPPAQRLSEWRYSPVLGQWELLRGDFWANSDLAWLRADGAIHWVTLLVGLAALATLALAWWVWWRTPVAKATQQLPSWPVRNLLMTLPLIVMAAWLSDSARDPHYGVPDQGYRAILADICTQARPDDVVITIAPYAYHIPMNWMGGLCGRGMPLFGYAADSTQYPEAQQVLSRIPEVYRRIWYITGGLPPNDPENTVEQWLATAAYKADDRWFDDFRLVRYATPIDLVDSQPVPLDMFLANHQGELVTIWSVRAPGGVRAGEIMPVELTYQLDTPVSANLRWFVQLLTADDTVVSLIDTAPNQGYASFSALPVGTQLVEKVALQLPESLAPGRYRLIAGLYNPEAHNANRLLTPTGRDSVDLGIIVVR
jgi:hypothetical protein